jgi:hypothetical protein
MHHHWKTYVNYGIINVKNNKKLLLKRIVRLPLLHWCERENFDFFFLYLYIFSRSIKKFKIIIIKIYFMNIKHYFSI